MGQLSEKHSRPDLEFVDEAPLSSDASYSARARKNFESVSERVANLIEKAKVQKAKKSKSSVDYSKGKPNAHCGICVHYEEGSCKLVSGEIEPDMWCELFEPRGE